MRYQLVASWVMDMGSSPACYSPAVFLGKSEPQFPLPLNGNDNGLSFLELVGMPGMERAWAGIGNCSMEHLSTPKLLMLLCPLPRSGLPGLCQDRQWQDGSICLAHLAEAL